ncbi:MAG: hypothetical protein FJW20_09435 [Acidimicrobiia bacterium]|nr:hypothetical protein [Acidimicrobiia bacterium]
MLAYLILRRFFPGVWWFCYLAGALAIAHTADRHFLWIGQLNQPGFIFWTLLACLLLVDSFRARRLRFALALTVGACLAEVLSLYSYEAQLPLMILFPAFLIWLPQGRVKSRPALLSGWYVLILLYARETVLSYAKGEGSYQQSMLHENLSSWTYLKELFLLAKVSLSFWDWTSSSEVEAPLVGRLVLGMVGSLVVVAGLRFALGDTWTRWGEDRPGQLLAALKAGAAGLVSSILVFAAMASAESRYRVLMLPGIGASIFMAGLAGLAAIHGPKRLGRWPAFLAVAGVIGFGINFGIGHGAVHFSRWEYHRQTMATLLKAIPALRPGTLLVVANVPDLDPFHYSKYWFDFTVRLAYPLNRVAGVYVYHDGTTPPNLKLRLDDTRWEWTETCPPSFFTGASVENSVIYEVNADGGRVVDEIPAFFHASVEAQRLYHPHERILPQASPIARTRYYPERSSWTLLSVIRPAPAH